MRKYIEAGKINNTHGVKGGLKIESWCDSPSVLSSFKTLYFKEGQDEYVPFRVLRASVSGDRVIFFLDGIDTVEKAEKLKNRTVFAMRDDIPLNGGVLIDDMKGLPVVDETSGRVYGTLTDVIKYGSRDVYEIKCGDKTVLFPAVREFVRRVEPEKGIFITPIAGFFDED